MKTFWGVVFDSLVKGSLIGITMTGITVEVMNHLDIWKSIGAFLASRF